MSIKISDFKNLFIGQFGEGMPRAFMGKPHMGAMLDTIQTVFALCAPGKVFQKVVRADTVSVATFMPTGAWTPEGFKNETVYQSPVGFAIPIKLHTKIPLVQVGIKNSSWTGIQDKLGASRIPHTLASGPVPIRPNPPLVRNFVTGKVGNWFKNLWGYGRILVSHGVALLHRVASGLGPYRCLAQWCGLFFCTIYSDKLPEGIA